MDLSRSQPLLTEQGITRLSNAGVLIFGIGGVGGYALEALVRQGIGRIGVVDSDTFQPSNLNRQLLATTDTIGKLKTEAARERMLSINPDLDFAAYPIRYDEASQSPRLEAYDYILDCIDSVKAKLHLIRQAKAKGIPIISCMGTGNRLDPTQLTITDISKTANCPLARIVRAMCRKEGISLTVVASTEVPVIQDYTAIPSVSFVPSVAGLLMAGRAILDIANITG